MLDSFWACAWAAMPWWCAQTRLLVSYRPLALPYNRDIMGKKNRRRDKGQFKLPSATSETSKKNLVSAIEERDPGYHRFQTLPADLCLAFGGGATIWRSAWRLKFSKREDIGCNRLPSPRSTTALAPRRVRRREGNLGRTGCDGTR